MHRLPEVRELRAEDVDTIAAAFAAWPKLREQYERYFAEQAEGRRLVLVAWCDLEICGYVTVVWQTDYPPFREAEVPEIQDLNVLPAFRKRGIATRLLAAAEEAVGTRSRVVGIGVGLYADYGAAQRLYVKRGYVPDGRGASFANQILRSGEIVVADDRLVLHLTKRLRA